MQGTILITSYVFDASAKTIQFTTYPSGALLREGIMLITNVEDGVIIYNFADAAKGGTVASDVGGDILTLDYDTTSMSDSDPLCIAYTEADIPNWQLSNDLRGASSRTLTNIYDSSQDINTKLGLTLSVLPVANDGIDIGDVTVNNASGASAVNIQDGGNVISVDDGGGSLTVDFTQPALVAGTALIGKVGIDQTTPGTTNAVQANAGTNLNTSLLALEAGGNLATIAGKDFATSAKQDTGNTSLGSIKTSVELIDDAIKTDDAAFTPATDKVMMIGAQFDDASPDSVNEGDAGAPRMSANRNLYVNIRDNAGNERGLNIDAAGAIAVSSHPVTNAGTFPVQIDGSALTALQLIDDPVVVLGTDTYTETTSKGNIIAAVRRDADTTLVNTTNEFAPLQLDARGFLKVEAFSGEVLPISDNAGSLTIDNAQLSVVGSGTEATAMRVTIATDSTGLLSVDDNGASLTVDNPQLSVVGGGTEATAMRVTIASDSTGTMTVDENGDTTITGQGSQTALNRNIILAAAAATSSNVEQYRSMVIQVNVAAGTVTAGAITFEASNDDTNFFAIFLQDLTVINANPVSSYSLVASTNRIFGGPIPYKFIRVRISTGVTGTTTGVQAYTYLSQKAWMQPSLNVNQAVGTPVNVQIGNATLSAGVIDETGASAVDALAVGGGTAHDAVDSGNPLKIGAKALTALPTAVASADRANAIADVYGRILTSHIDPAMQVAITKTSFNATTTQTGAAMWTPTSGKKIAITSLIIGTYGTTAARVIIWIGASGDTTFSEGTDHCVAKASFAPSATVKPGLVYTPMEPIFSQTADHILKITTDAGISIDVTWNGYEY